MYAVKTKVSIALTNIIIPSVLDSCWKSYPKKSHLTGPIFNVVTVAIDLIHRAESLVTAANRRVSILKEVLYALIYFYWLLLLRGGGFSPELRDRCPLQRIGCDIVTAPVSQRPAAIHDSIGCYRD